MEDRKMLSAADIFGAEDERFVDVDVEEWGGTVRLRAMTAEEAISFLKIIEGPNRALTMIYLVLKMAVDDVGRQLFAEGDLEALKKKNVAPFVRLQKAAMALNGMEGIEAAKNA